MLPLPNGGRLRLACSRASMHGAGGGVRWAATRPNALTITPAPLTPPRPLLVPEPVTSPALTWQTGIKRGAPAGRVPRPADGARRREPGDSGSPGAASVG